MRALRFLGPAVVLCATAGCLRESNIEPVRETVMVHSVATVGRMAHGVTLAILSTRGVPSPLNGATITLRRGDDVITLAQAGTTSPLCFDPEAPPIEAQCYAAELQTPIESGETLDLTIELPDGTRIVGSTTTPAPPVVEEPAAGSDVQIEFIQEFDGSSGFSIHDAPVEVRWTGTGDRPADVQLDVDAIYDDGVEVECGDVFFEETTHTRSPAHVRAPFHCQGSHEDPVYDSARVTLRVVAYDDNASDYIEATNETGTGIVIDGASPGLDVADGSALMSGVFGSAAQATVPVTLHATLVVAQSGGSRASRTRTRP